ncbi:MAG: hypothetical protein ACE5OZ_20995 [Candidatus Heimdallarchaeota archaeon]
MRLGDLQPEHSYRFLGEAILEETWPFSQLKTPWNVVFLTILYWGAGTILFAYLDLPAHLYVRGLMMGLGITVWSWGIYKFAEKIRSTKIEQISRVKQKFLRTFLDDLFNERSLVLGIILFVASISYLWGDGEQTVFKEVSSTGSPHPVLLIYLLILIFDVCYRFGLSIYTTSMLPIRNIRLSTYIRDPELNPHLSTTDIDELKQADKYTFLLLLGGILQIPMALLDPLMSIGLILYLIFLSFAAAISLVHLKILERGLRGIQATKKAKKPTLQFVCPQCQKDLIIKMSPAMILSQDGTRKISIPHEDHVLTVVLDEDFRTLQFTIAERGYTADYLRSRRHLE